MAELDLLFLPWMRRGASRRLLQPRDGRRGVGISEVTLMINEQVPVTVPVTMMGPGQITGLDARQVIRTDPVAGATNFEANFFPLIEFDEPSLPWLFTPVPAELGIDRLLPWLCLVVVRRQPGVSVDPPRLGPLPRLNIQQPANVRDELPDLTESWAWAHAQLIAGDSISDASLNDLRPEQTLSRLLCPRILQPETDYIACVVPTFELGRKAGLGEDIKPGDEAALAPAWEFPPPAAGESSELPDHIELPVYYSWEFRTAAGGDFRSLAMLLHAANPIPDGLGVQPIDVGQSGLSAAIPEQTTMRMAGALRVRGTTAGTWPDDSVQNAWEAALKPVLNASGDVTDEQDPLLAPPLYGTAQASLVVLNEQNSSRWFEQLNLSPVYRATAHLGARVVVTHQDALMASAWEQAAELEKANQLLRQQQFAARLATSLHKRHIGAMDAATGLQVLAPARARLMSLRSRAAETGKFEQLLSDTGLDPAFYANSLRRVTRSRGSVFRRVREPTTGDVPISKPRSVLERLQPIAMMARAAPPTGGPISPDRVAAALNPPRSDIHWNEAIEPNVLAAPQAPAFAFMPPGQPVAVSQPKHGHPHPFPHHPLPHHPLPHQPHFPHLPPHHGPHGDDFGIPEQPEIELPPDWEPGPAAVDSPAAKAFREVAAAHLKVFNPAPPAGPPAEPRPIGSLDAITAAFAQALFEIRPQATFLTRVEAVLEVPGPERADAAELAPVRLSPHFPQPMVEPLSELAQDLVLPGLDKVPANTVLPLETNPAFVEAFMVGLNHEMGRELVWRGYPADLRATYFDRFWRTPYPVWPADIEHIAHWSDRSLTIGANDGNFVLLVRSELLKRYPNAVISASNQDTGEEKHPVFAGGFPPDVRYVGFDIPANEIAHWSIIIKEHPSAPRFGLRTDQPQSGAHASTLGETAAATAKAARIPPVRITLPPSMLSEVA